MHVYLKSSLLMSCALATVSCTIAPIGEADVEGMVATSSQATATARPDINAAFVDPDVNVEMWADRWTGESREVFTLRNEVLAALGLKPGDRVADIGAGTGLFVKLFAESVGAEGRVYAVDISQPFLDFVAKNASADGLENVETILGEDRTSNLATASVDIIFHSDVYHHFAYPEDMVRDLARVLVDNGEMYVLDFERIEGVTSQRLLDHVRAGKEVVTAEIEAWGFKLVEEIEVPGLEENYLLRFRKE